MRVIEYKGKKYQIDNYYCSKCKADAGANYCVNSCDYNMERLPINKNWVCKSCGHKNTDTDILLEEEYAVCSKCGTHHIVDVENGVVVNIEIYED